MKSIFSVLLFCFLTAAAFGQDVTGHWKTIDDETGDPKSVVQIYKTNDGRYEGKIVKLYRKPTEDQDPVCKECPKSDARHGKKINGMVIISDLKKEGNEFSGGEIMDPKNGKSYTCKIWTEGKDVLKVRGYLGFFYRTQTWHRTTDF
jgi:uncharacterized protein (DUF2147 family)